MREFIYKTAKFKIQNLSFLIFIKAYRHTFYFIKCDLLAFNIFLIIVLNNLYIDKSNLKGYKSELNLLSLQSEISLNKDNTLN
ncbi:hypothetical protein B0A68_16495 [Flavobacterium reichenbachii]|uniref:Uncharacterized protein n=1 Tax=Flavobacterium reichenbachii TaxID=362418 RepID=A0A085ZRT7_9FLAO|nr:hypothetical protein IW19_17290 [Flavobacterium reichenbachii]OXB13354.1 hypothetical protein B0A68_16495 [Flavobacterium reichenbachii]